MPTIAMVRKIKKTKEFLLYNGNIKKNNGYYYRQASPTIKQQRKHTQNILSNPSLTRWNPFRLNVFMIFWLKEDIVGEPHIQWIDKWNLTLMDIFLAIFYIKLDINQLIIYFK